ncbi:undecaprenyl-diphosphate phosphatase [Pseudothermotoga sp. U03pept]|uniref:undecaprenyl-diphosphate phosphatase n=1 Tax=Pseudothermotoga sp. U03pept TaxID=3447012 RepID=UPI003F0F81BD
MNNVLLAITQGITEFLPVSSSGHLVFLGELLGIKAELPFAAMLHLGTLLAVFLFAVNSLLRALKNVKVVLNLVVSTIPAVVVGFTMNEKVEEIFSNTKVLPIFFCITSFLLLISSFRDGNKILEEMKFSDALIIGLFQALAILPGVSRSGATLAGALLLGFKKDDALSYSFLLAIPVIGGAGLLEFSQMDPSWFYLGVISFVVGLGSLFVLKKIVLSQKLRIFADYCLLIAVISFFLG